MSILTKIQGIKYLNKILKLFKDIEKLFKVLSLFLNILIRFNINKEIL